MKEVIEISLKKYHEPVNPFEHKYQGVSWRDYFLPDSTLGVLLKDLKWSGYNRYFPLDLSALILNGYNPSEGPKKFLFALGHLKFRLRSNVSVHFAGKYIIPIFSNQYIPIGKYQDQILLLDSEDTFHVYDPEKKKVRYLSFSFEGIFVRLI